MNMKSPMKQALRDRKQKVIGIKISIDPTGGQGEMGEELLSEGPGPDESLQHEMAEGEGEEMLQEMSPDEAAEDEMAGMGEEESEELQKTSDLAPGQPKPRSLKERVKMLMAKRGQ